MPTGAKYKCEENTAFWLLTVVRICSLWDFPGSFSPMCSLVQIIRYALKKKYGIIREFFPSGGLPPPFWEPLIREKKNYRLFCILGP